MFHSPQLTVAECCTVTLLRIAGDGSIKLLTVVESGWITLLTLAECVKSPY